MDWNDITHRSFRMQGGFIAFWFGSQAYSCDGNGIVLAAFRNVFDVNLGVEVIS